MSAVQAPPPSDPRPITASLGERLPWDVYEVFRCAWNAYRAHGLALAAASGVSWAALASVDAAGEYVLGDAPDAPWLVVNGPDIFSKVVAACLQAGFLGVALAIAKGRRPSARDFFERAARAGPTLFLLNVLFGSAFVAQNLSALYLVYYLLPFDGPAFAFAYQTVGVLLLLTFAFAPYYVVDAGLGPFAALRATWRASEGKRLHIILASMPGTAFTVGPLSVYFPGSWFVVELLVKPICAVALAIAFLRVTGRGALRDALPPPEGFGPAAYRGKRFRR
jgi:hypothetical protein